MSDEMTQYILTSSTNSGIKKSPLKWSLEDVYQTVGASTVFIIKYSTLSEARKSSLKWFPDNEITMNQYIRL